MNTPVKGQSWEDTEILITGGSGSLGKALTKRLLKDYHPRGIRIYSRSEALQDTMKKEIDILFPGAPIAYLIGDVRDFPRLKRAMEGVDILYHLAAMKMIPASEYNPMEAVKTNINGAINVIDAAIDNGIKKVLNISTDKCCKSINLYGATKSTGEKLFLHSDIYAGARNIRFSSARYGNVAFSTGSVIPFFLEKSKTGEFPITDINMTRFWITLDQAVDFVIECMIEMNGHEIFIPKMPSFKIEDLANAINPEAKKKIVGIRKGEKVHECIIAKEELMYTHEKKNKYIITEKKAKKIISDEDLNSFNNDWWLSVDDLKELIK